MAANCSGGTPRTNWVQIHQFVAEQGSGKPEPGPTMYKVMISHGGKAKVWITGQSRDVAQAIANNLNGLAREKGSTDEYTVEAE